MQFLLTRFTSVIYSTLYNKLVLGFPPVVLLLSSLFTVVCSLFNYSPRTYIFEIQEQLLSRNISFFWIKVRMFSKQKSEVLGQVKPRLGRWQVINTLIWEKHCYK